MTEQKSNPTTSASSSSTATAIPTTPSESNKDPTSMPISRSRVTQIPTILYGTAWKTTQTTSLVLSALSSGFRGIDTAAQRKHYREDLVGEALSLAADASRLNLAREDLWIQTKFTPISGQDVSDVIPYNQNDDVATQVVSSFSKSLQNLFPHQQESQRYLDSYLLHSPLNTLADTIQAWRVLEHLVDQGKVKKIGFSNVYDPQIFSALFQAARIKPSILQNRWHSTTGHDVSLLSKLSPVLSPNDLSIPIIYQPFWSLTGNPALLDSIAIQTIAIERNLTPQQVLYAFLSKAMGIPGLQITVLCGSTNVKHLEQAIDAVHSVAPTLSVLDVEQIRKQVYGE